MINFYNTQPYDYGSVMHYGRKAFSLNGLDTIIPRFGGARIGQRYGLSVKDVKEVNAVYRWVKASFYKFLSSMMFYQKVYYI